MKFKATTAPVIHGSSHSKDSPPVDFLADLVEGIALLDNNIFAPNSERYDVFSSVFPVIEPWEGEKLSLEWFTHRKAVMCEVLRVLGGFESNWNWKEGKDQSSHHENDDETKSAGLWQISYNSRNFGDDLKMLIERWGIRDGEDFQAIMRQKKSFAIEYAVLLFRHTTQHNGPLKRHEVDGQMSRDAIKEFQHLLNG